MKMKPIIYLLLVVIIAVGAFLIGSKFGTKSPQTASVSNTSAATSTLAGTDSDGMDDEHEFLQADYNFDGYRDQLKMLDCGATGNCSYEVELYDSETKTYLSSVDSTPRDVESLDPNDDSEVVFVVTNPSVNKAEKLVCSYANIGAGSYYLNIYKYSVKDNAFYQVKNFSGSTDKVHGCTLK